MVDDTQIGRLSGPTLSLQVLAQNISIRREVTEDVELARSSQFSEGHDGTHAWSALSVWLVTRKVGPYRHLTEAGWAFLLSTILWDAVSMLALGRLAWSRAPFADISVLRAMLDGCS